jgi:uncharacterized protein with HEPN domain
MRREFLYLKSLNSEMTRGAVAQKLTIIGEAAGRVSRALDFG